jgi:hypothetical protein
MRAWLTPPRRRLGWGLLAGVVVLLALGVVLRLRLGAVCQARLTRATGHRVLVSGTALGAGGVVLTGLQVFGAPPFDADPLARIDRVQVRLGGGRGLFSPSEVLIDGLELEYLSAGSLNNVGAPKGGGSSGGPGGPRIVVRSGRLRGTLRPAQGPQVLLRVRSVTGEITPSGARTASLQGVVAELAGWASVTVPELVVRNDAAGTSARADGAALAIPGGGNLIEELAVNVLLTPGHAEVSVTREPGPGKPRAVPRLRATFRADGQGGQLGVDAAELALHPLHPLLDRLGLTLDETRADVHLLASLESGRAQIPYELDLRVRGLEVHHPGIDGTGWKGLSAELHASGALAPASPDGGPRVVVDRGELEAFGVRLGVSGWTELGPLPRGSISVKSPAPLACGRLLPAQPGPVQEALSGLRLAGNLGLSAALGFDAAAWDSLTLDLELEPLCEVVSEPRVLSDLLHALKGGHAPPGETAALPLGKYHPDFAPLAKMPAHLPAAFLTAEDGRFFNHAGFDLEMIRRALAHDLEMQTFAKGGSTITQQLAKNLFLSPSRTLARKLEETVLAWRLETLLSKNRTLELYLNVIELGPHIHGVKQAARAYFGKDLEELRPIESAHLAALTPNPRGLARRFRDGRVDEGWMHRLQDLLGMMNRSGRLSRSDLAAARSGRLTLRKI